MMPSGLSSSPSPKYLPLASAQPPKSPSMVSSVAGVRVRVARVVGALDLEVADVDERAVAGLGVQLLALGALLEVQEVLGRLRGAVDDRARVLDEQGLVRDDVVEVLAALAGEDRLVLVGEEHVTGAAGERRGGVAAAVGQRGDVAEELLHVLLRRPRRCHPSSSAAPYAARRFHLAEPEEAGFGRHDADAGLDQVVPAVDVLGVALAGPRRPRRSWCRCPWCRCPSSPRPRGPRRPDGSRPARARGGPRRPSGRPRPHGTGRRRRRRTP